MYLPNRRCLRQVDHAREVALGFVAAKHFLSDEISDRVEEVAKRYRERNTGEGRIDIRLIFFRLMVVKLRPSSHHRYESLQEPAHIRGENLEDALLLQQLLLDIGDELLWLGEKEPLAASQVRDGFY